MTNDQHQQFERIDSIPERAMFLLDIGVQAVLIDDVGVKYQARVGDLILPITASTEVLAIKRATDWLRTMTHKH